MRRAQHPNIIEFIAAVERGSERYLMFRWAEEGNLRNFWEANSRPTLTTALVKDAVYQIRGLADALDKLHTGKHKPGGESFRHGDLKPENILCVTTDPSQAGCVNIPMFKISDMGLTKPHSVATELRPPTSMRYTTARYEPPEVILESDSAVGQGGRSRRYDMWSLGCVVLETIIWLLFGNKNLEVFNNKIVDEMGQKGHWFERKREPGDSEARPTVQHHVQDTIRALLRDQECAPGTAMRELLDIVRQKLLVVELGNATFYGGDIGSPQSRQGCRVYSEELLRSLNDMVGKGEKDEGYWFTGKSRDKLLPLVAIPDPEAGPMQQTFLSPQAALGTGQRFPIHPRGIEASGFRQQYEPVSLAVPPAAEDAFKTRRVSPLQSSCKSIANPDAPGCTSPIFRDLGITPLVETRLTYGCLNIYCRK